MKVGAGRLAPTDLEKREELGQTVRNTCQCGLGMTVAVGFDYLLTENFTLGFAAEYHGMLTDMQAFPAYAAFTGRVGFRLPY